MMTDHASSPSSMIHIDVKAIFKEPDLALKITTTPLNGSNYIVWAKSASLYLYGRGKYGYVNRKAQRPEESDAMLGEWELNDRTMMSCLLNSIEPSIVEEFLFLDYAKEVWDSAVEIYGGKENLARMYQLQFDIAKTVKGDKVFHVYLNNLKSLCDELQ